MQAWIPAFAGMTAQDMLLRIPNQYFGMPASKSAHASIPPTTL